MVASGKHRRDTELEGNEDDEETGGGGGEGGEGGGGGGGKTRTISGELNALTFEDTTGGAKSGSGSASINTKKGSSLMGMFGKKSDTSLTADQKLEAAALIAGGSKGGGSSKPTIIEGYLEKKHHIGAMHISSEWQKVFCKIDEPTTSLMYFKASNLNSAAGSIDLKMVSSIEPYEKGTRKEDYSRFNIDMGDGKVYKFKSKGSAEGTEWLNKLEAWREYFLLHG